MRVQLWHIVVLMFPVVLALLLYVIVRQGVAHGVRDASRDRAQRLE